MNREDIAPGDPVFWNRTFQDGTTQVPCIVKWRTPHMIAVSVIAPDGREIIRHAKPECLTPGIGYRREPANPARLYAPGEKRPPQLWSAGE